VVLHCCVFRSCIYLFACLFFKGDGPYYASRLSYFSLSVNLVLDSDQGCTCYILDGVFTFDFALATASFRHGCRTGIGVGVGICNTCIITSEPLYISNNHEHCKLLT
jgi:hypothetical protein